jgi:hypothetical protein
MLTLEELKERMKREDEVSILELLDIESADLVEQFDYLIERKFDILIEEYEDDVVE